MLSRLRLRVFLLSSVVLMPGTMVQGKLNVVFFFGLHAGDLVIAAVALAREWGTAWFFNWCAGYAPRFLVDNSALSGRLLCAVRCSDMQFPSVEVSMRVRIQRTGHSKGLGQSIKNRVKNRFGVGHNL